MGSIAAGAEHLVHPRLYRTVGHAEARHEHAGGLPGTGGEAMSRASDGFNPAGWRSVTMLLFFGLAAAGLAGRALYLQVLDKQFLLTQGAERHLRVEEIPAHRGMILDRNGEPLAVSTPVDSIWINPQELSQAPGKLPELARALGVSSAALTKQLRDSGDKEFLYLARGLDPYDAQRVTALGIPGVYTQREYRRY